MAPDCKVSKEVGLNSDATIMINYERCVILIDAPGKYD